MTMQQSGLVQMKNALQPQEMKFSGDFPDGVIENIFVRLPVKSLIRFKAVCKSWRDFLGCRYFGQIQMDHAKRSQMLLVYSVRVNAQRGLKPHITMVRKENNSFEIHRVFTMSDRCVIEDSCNGLVSFKLNSSPRHVYLWNPATKKSKRVKLPDTDVNPCVGLAFVAETNDYKMVRIPSYCFDYSSERKESVWMYSLNSDSWKELKLSLKYGPLVSGHAVSLKGCMHWLTKEGGQHIATFDVENEVLDYLPLMADTDGFLTSCRNRQLGVIKGSLSIVFAYRSREFFDLVYEVWQMTECGVGNSWRMVAFITPFDEIVAFPIGLYNDGILFQRFQGNGEEVFYYDPFTRVIKPIPLGLCLNMQIVNYNETLVSLESGKN